MQDNWRVGKYWIRAVIKEDSWRWRRNGKDVNWGDNEGREEKGEEEEGEGRGRRNAGDGVDGVTGDKRTRKKSLEKREW